MCGYRESAAVVLVHGPLAPEIEDEQFILVEMFDASHGRTRHGRRPLPRVDAGGSLHDEGPGRREVTETVEFLAGDRFVRTQAARGRRLALQDGD